MAEVGSLIRAEQVHIALAAVWVLIEADLANVRVEEQVLRLLLSRGARGTPGG
jgi:hypothetical protein